MKTKEQFAGIVRAAKTLEVNARDLFTEIGNLHSMIDESDQYPSDLAHAGAKMFETVSALARFRDRLECAGNRAFGPESAGKQGE